MTYFKEKKSISKLKIAQDLRRKVLVHAVPNIGVFKSILQSGAILVPSQHKRGKKSSRMEKVLHIDNCIHLSLGFDYNAQIFQWPFSFLFSLKQLEYCTFYKVQLVWSAYKIFIDHVYRNDRSYFDTMKLHPRLIEIIKKYLQTNRKEFDFWKEEKTIMQFFDQYRYKEDVIAKIGSAKSKLYLQYPASKSFAENVYRTTDKNREIISSRKILIKNNPACIGVYCAPQYVHQVKKLLQGTSVKMIYDGKRVLKL